MWIPSIAAHAACGMDERRAVGAVPRLPLLYVTAAVLLVAYVWFLGPGVTLHLA